MRIQNGFSFLFIYVAGFMPGWSILSEGDIPSCDFGCWYVLFLLSKIIKRFHIKKFILFVF